MATLSKTGRKVLTDLAGGKWGLWHQPTWEGEDRYVMSAPTLVRRYGVHKAVVHSLLAPGYLWRRPGMSQLHITAAGLAALEQD